MSRQRSLEVIQQAEYVTIRRIGKTYRNEIQYLEILYRGRNDSLYSARA